MLRSARKICQRLITTVTILLAATAPVFCADPPLFERNVLPVFADKCGKCHGHEIHKAELNLQTFAARNRGGESGPAVVAGSPGESLLFEMIDDGTMPPKGEPPLSQAQIAAIREWIAAGAHSEAHPTAKKKEVSYLDVVPLMLRRCVMCHGPEYQLGGLDLREHALMLKGGDSGAALIQGDPNGSLMISRVAGQLCPPKEDIGESGIEPMTPGELQQLQDWIAAGAKSQPMIEDVATEDGDSLVTNAERRFWSFIPPKKMVPPKVDPAAATTAIDAFIFRKLAEAGLPFSPAADRRTLARRAAFMLTGLPPEEGFLNEFLNDEKADAWQTYLDQLLNSPRYGEKWGRFWLDLAGYADSEGKRSADSVRPFAWKYRDWVIKASNADIPYNEFLLEQIAGDELVDWANADQVTPDVVDKLTATGFLRMVPDGTAADPVNRFSDRMEVISDAIDVLSRSVLGLTMNCARCHSHKYDPIPQRDYYRMVAVFKGAYDEYDWLTPHAFNNQWKRSKQRLLEVATPEDHQASVKHHTSVRLRLKEIQKKLKKKGLSSTESKRLKDEAKNLTAQIQPPKIRALWDRGRPSPTFIYRRGDETQPGKLVGPGVPSVLTDGRSRFRPVSIRHSSPKSGRRLAFAQWLTADDHPLTARVIVNRIWQQHFGQGIVQSIDNFGKLGTPPSHPDLLDWLAVDFVENGWSIRRLHRQIMTSVVWQQSSRVTEQHLERDPENRLLSRMPMRRLSAEEVRDTLLLISGRLNETSFGEPDPVEVRKDGLVTSKPVDGKWRRSIYVRQRRKEMPTLFETFDLPQMSPNCTARSTSTVVNQSLLLMNNRMVRDLADALADRVREEAGPDETKLLPRAFEMAFNRPPSKEENDALLYAFHSFEVELVSETGVAGPDAATTAPATSSGGESGNETAAPLVSHAATSSDTMRNALSHVCHSLMNSASLIYVD